MGGLWTEVRGQQKQSNDPGNNQHNPQYANYWAPLTRKRHIPPHPAQPRHTDHWAPRTRKRHQQEHRPQRPTERSDPTQHAKGRTGDCPGPRKGATTRRNVTQGGRKVPQTALPLANLPPQPHPRSLQELTETIQQRELKSQPSRASGYKTQFGHGEGGGKFGGRDFVFQSGPGHFPSKFVRRPGHPLPGGSAANILLP